MFHLPSFSFKCETCELAFGTEEALKVHRNAFCTTVQSEFACTVCNKTLLLTGKQWVGHRENHNAARLRHEDAAKVAKKRKENLLKN